MSALRSWRDGSWEERKEQMAPLQKTLDLARSLIAFEADAARISLHTQPATVPVYEKLRRQLGASVGVDGFQALATRALALARSESPRLGAVQLSSNGCLLGLGEVETQTDADEDNRAEAALLKHHSVFQTQRWR